MIKLLTFNSSAMPLTRNLTSIAVLSTLLCTSLGSTNPVSSQNHPQFSDSDREVTQLFYPDAREGQNIKVIGIGQASQSADRAILTLRFTIAETLSSQGIASLPPEAFVEALKPIVSALTAAGIENIETQIPPPSQQVLPFPGPRRPDPDGAAIVVSLDNPESEDLDKVIEIVQDVGEGSDRVRFRTAQVQFELEDCAALAGEAYQAAVRDAQNRAEAISGAIGATLDTPAVSEPFYIPVLPGCLSPSLSYFNQPQTYKPNMEMELTIIRQLFFTYPTRSGF